MAESNEDENNDVQMKEICVIPIDQPGQKSRADKMSALLFYILARNGNAVFNSAAEQLPPPGAGTASAHNREVVPQILRQRMAGDV